MYICIPIFSCNGYLLLLSQNTLLIFICLLFRKLVEWNVFVRLESSFNLIGQQFNQLIVISEYTRHRVVTEFCVLTIDLLNMPFLKR